MLSYRRYNTQLFEITEKYNMSFQYSFLSDSDMILLEELGSIRTYEKNETILTENAVNDRVFWIRKGIVRIEHTHFDDKVVLAGIGTGELFGEIAYLTGSKATASVIARTTVEVLEVDFVKLSNLIQTNDGFAARFYHTTSITLASRLYRQSH